MSIVDFTSNALKESATKAVGDSASKAVTGAVSNSVSGAANTISSTASNAVSGASNAVNNVTGSVSNVVSGASNAVSGVSNAVSGAVSKVLTNVAVGAAVGAVSGTVTKALTKVAVGAIAGAAAGAVTGAVATVLSGSIAKLTEPASTAKFTLEIPGSGLSTSVYSFSAHEEMSKPFMINLTIACKDKIPFDKIMGKEALLTIASAEAGPRYFHGVISTFRRAGSQGKYLYDATMVPYLDLLSMSTDCRIFQKMTVVDIVKKVFEQYKREIGTDKYKFLALKENGDKIKRSYCVQYRETDLDFISRILAEEGIFYYFEHYKDKHVIIFGDNTMNYKDISSAGPIAFNASSNMSTDTESISSFDLSHHLTPGEVVHSEYNFKNSSVKQKAKANADENSVFNLEVYDYPGNYLSESQGKTVSRIHLESIKKFEKRADASSNAPRLSAGFIFKMDQGKDVQYLVTSISHGGSQPQVLEEFASGQTSYSNAFVCIPATTIFRPHLYPKPVVTGTQSAVVVGPKGEEIHTDEHGRVRVQFHWDRLGKMDENSSCMLRVAQTWSGGARGAQHIPRIGDEVLISFLEGDPDRPIVTGSAYNSDNQPINNLKQSITQSGFRTKSHKGDGFHELRFDDAKGSEEIFLHSQKDLNMNVNDRRGLSVGGNSGIVIGGNCEKSVKGDYYTDASGTRTDLAKHIILGGDTSITIVCGPSSIVLSSSGIKINGPKVDINDGSKAPEPVRKKVSGSTGKGGGSSQPKAAAKPASKPEPAKPAPKPEPAKPDDDWKVGPLKDRELEPNEHLIYADGTEAPSSIWGKGDLGTDVAMHIPDSLPDLPTDPSALANAGLSKAGGLVSSLIPAGLQNNIKNVSSTLDSTKGKLLDKINPDDVIKKF